MNIQEVSKIYQEISNNNNGTQIIRFDLHIHSPASSDYIYDKHNQNE